MADGSKNLKEALDITIIGAGPVGLFAAYYAGLRALRAKVIDSLPKVGGQLISLYPKKNIYDVAGFPKILAEELVQNLLTQAMEYHPEICLEQRIQKLEYADGNLIRLATENGIQHLTRTAIISAGTGSLIPRRLELPSVEKYVDHGLTYVVLDPEEYRGKKVLVVGGGDTALDWALALKDIAKETTLIHRSGKFAAHEDSVRKVFGSHVRTFTHTELKAIHGDGRVTGATIFNREKDEELTLELDAIIVCIGFTPNLGALKEWGLEIEKHSIKVNTRMETNLPGVYAVGDVVDYPGKVKLIVTGFGDAAVAVCHAAHRINPQLKIFPGYSTNFVEKLQARAQSPAKA